MSTLLRSAADSLLKYWTILVAAAALIWYLGGFVVNVQQLQTEQAELRVRIVALEERQTKTDEKIGVQQVEVLTRLSRIEGILEELRKDRR